MTSDSMRAMLRLYLSALSVTGYSPRTRTDKEFCITKFIEWCEARDVTSISAVSPDLVERYQKHLYHHQSETTKKQLSFYTQRSRLSALCGFYSWMVKKGHIVFNPTSDITLPRIGKHLPKNILSIEEVKTIMNTPDINTPLGVRDRAILETFYSTAVRRSELINLMLVDLNADQGVLMVRHGKGDKDRLIPIGNQALMWVEKYMDEVRPRLTQINDSGHIFVTQHGNPFSLSALSNMVKGYFNQAEITGRATCHALRHAAATHMLEAGADIRFIQEQLGHTDINTTTVYTRVSIRKLKEVHDRCLRG